MDETPQSLSFIVSGKDDVDLVQVGYSLRRTEIPTFDNPLNFLKFAPDLILVHTTTWLLKKRSQILYQLFC